MNKLKETIEQLQYDMTLCNHRRWGKSNKEEDCPACQDRQFAIFKLELLEQVEKGGVEKILPETRITQLDEVSFNKGRIVGFNSAIDLCQADLVKRLEGIEEVIQKELNYYVESECPSVKTLSQALITHLGKEK